MDAITASGLSKSYDGVQFALKDLSLSIPQGSVFGFLGPNGAGKTTTVKLLTGLLKPTSGECAILDQSPAHYPTSVHKVCGVMTETAKMYHFLTGMQNLVFFGEAYGMEAKAAEKRANELLKELGQRSGVEEIW